MSNLRRLVRTAPPATGTRPDRIGRLRALRGQAATLCLASCQATPMYTARAWVRLFGRA